MALMLGIIGLLLLQSMRINGRTQQHRVLAALGTAFVLMTISVGVWLSPPRYLPAAATSGLATGFARGVREGLAAGEPFFVMIDGGSHTARGVDTKILEARLSTRMKRPVKVLEFALAGGNHLERWALLRDGIALMSDAEREDFGRAPKIILLEISEAYDNYPLVQLARNRNTDRAYAYLRPGIALEAWHSDHGDLDPAVRRAQWIDVTTHAVKNMFNVGAARRMVPVGDVEPQSGYSPLTDPKAGFRFRGMDHVRRAIPVTPESVRDISVPLSNIERRRARILEAVGERYATVVYFSVPTTRDRSLLYATAFCDVHQDYSCVMHGDRRLADKLDHKRYWYDDGHLQDRGAVIYTRWLADRVPALRVKRDVK